jgi:hypothetical protein
MESLSTFLNLDSIRTLGTDDPCFLDAIVGQHKTLRVEELHLHTMRLRNYSNDLAQMPYLLTLIIDYNTPQTYTGLYLSPVSMPKLQNLCCPAFIAQYIIPGRPLKNIDIYTPVFRERTIPTPSTLLRLIQLSTAPIKKLHIPTCVYLESPREFGNTFPDLDELCLTLMAERLDDTVCHSNSSKIINNLICLSAHSQFAEQVSAITDGASTGLLPISHLTIRFKDILKLCKWVFYLADQAKMATRLHCAIPALESIDFVTWDQMGWTWRLQYS